MPLVRGGCVGRALTVRLFVSQTSLVGRLPMRVDVRECGWDRHPGSGELSGTFLASMFFDSLSRPGY